MRKTEPFLTGLSALLCGRAKRKTQDILSAKRLALREGGSLDIQQQFIDEIDPELLESHSTTQRVRDYPDPLTFWAFLSQVTSEDSSCARTVSRVQAWCRQNEVPVPASGTGSYCDARQSLPVEMLQAVNTSLCRQLDVNLPTSNLWRGHSVKAEDGTTAQMPDTQPNREAYPYPSGQADGCGHPVIRLGGLIDLGHGGLQDFAHSNLQTSELRAHDQLEVYLEHGDILVQPSQSQGGNAQGFGAMGWMLIAGGVLVAPPVQSPRVNNRPNSAITSRGSEHFQPFENTLQSE